MNIGIILHPYGEDNPAGLARIIFELTKELILRDKDNHYTIFLKKRPKVLPVFQGSRWNIEIVGEGIFWLDRLKRKKLCDAYIFNTPALPIFWKPPYTIILALDFAYWYFRPSGLRGFISTYITYWYHRFSLEKADKIVSISEATRQDLFALFPRVKKEKVQTIYFGFRNIGAILAQEIPGLPEHFFLFIGVWKERKNVLGVVQAFALFAKKYLEAYLVLVGKSEGIYAQKIKEYIQHERLEKKIKILGFASDAELSYLYQHARALVFPSFIEGFGFPILEAMAAGLPVITANQSSLIEIGGSAALCVDPQNPAAIAEAMERLYADEALAEDMRKKGIRKVADFSWNQTVSAFLAIMKTKASA